MFTDKDLEDLAAEISEFVDNFVHDKADQPDRRDIKFFLQSESKVIYHLKRLYNGEQT